MCFAPVYRFGEAHEHPHNVARALFVPAPGGGRQVAPAPRFSRTEATLTTPPPATAGAQTRAALTAWGLKDVGHLIAAGVAVDTTHR